MLERTIAQWQAAGAGDLWVFGYASLIWRPDFAVAERRAAKVYGWHRALQMWSTVNRGSPAERGLVFALLSGGSCKGMVLRVARADVRRVLALLWLREMPNGVYDPQWLPCATAQGTMSALAFTLSKRSPSYTGRLSDAQYAHIFAHATGRYGTTKDYAQATLDGLRAVGIEDAQLAALLASHANP